MKRYEVHYRSRGDSDEIGQVFVVADSDEKALRAFAIKTPGVRKTDIIALNRCPPKGKPGQSIPVPIPDIELPAISEKPRTVASKDNPSSNKPSIRASNDKTTRDKSNIPPAVYKTTTHLGSFFIIAGWLGVALSVFAGIATAQTVGMPGIAAGFAMAFLCLMTVAAGQLLQAQVEIANNSRLMLVQLETLNRPKD